MRFEVERARGLFKQGLPLLQRVPKRLRLDLDLFTRGGEEILNLIEAQGFDVLTRRPSLSKARKVALILRRLVGSIGR
jgi:phytoene/squalene synthetase